MKNQALVRHFHRVFGFHVADKPDVGSYERRDFRFGLIKEEWDELAHELGKARPDINKIAHEAADVMYVLYGLAVEMGFNLDAVLREVHRANMTKDPNPGGGKALKGAGFVPAVVHKVVSRG